MTSTSRIGAAMDSGDFRNLEALKRDLRTGDAAATRDATKIAAQKFEAEFLNLLMKQMRAALPQEDPLSSNAMKSWQSMSDQRLTEALSQKGIGLAAMIERQLSQGKTSGMDATQTTNSPMAALGVPAVNAAPPAQATDATTAVTPLRRLAATSPSALAAPGLANRVTGAAVRRELGSQRDFVERVNAEAKIAAEKTGIPAEYMVGQAALESGWGKREIRAADGSPSFNLFGIKAGKSWTGKTIEVTTTEYVNGVAQKVKAKFRAYASYAEGFADYAKLISTSPRYAASRHAGSAIEFARALQQGGYATDPLYAQKLAGTIASTERIARTLV
ncbi:MAG: flagellar assembly peptidoglycan hydrolase FlgJ [Burkholderiales bacterium]|nr:flagellar assembly peptidoglycan hydrolase FlgJ [Burkholderiales bacterium]